MTRARIFHRDGPWPRGPRRLALIVLACSLVAGPVPGTRDAGAHLFVTPETLNSALEKIADWRTLTEEPVDRSDDHHQLYQLGEAAWQMAELLNEEVRLHGIDQWELMMESVESAKELDVSIEWSDAHRRFFYDGEAYRRYLEAAPDGPFAADSTYRLLELDFYLGAAGDIEALAAKATAKREFLEAYPDFPNGARIGIFLGIDYRDLYRLCLEQDDAECEGRYARLAIEQFRRTAAEHAGSDSGELASRLLSRTQSEIESAR